MENSFPKVMLTVLAPDVPNEGLSDEVPGGVGADGAFLPAFPENLLILRLSSQREWPTYVTIED
jgi:hypothetical protein